MISARPSSPCFPRRSCSTTLTISIQKWKACARTLSGIPRPPALGRVSTLRSAARWSIPQSFWKAKRNRPRVNKLKASRVIAAHRPNSKPHRPEFPNQRGASFPKNKRTVPDCAHSRFLINMTDIGNQGGTMRTRLVALTLGLFLAFLLLGCNKNQYADNSTAPADNSAAAPAPADNTPPPAPVKVERPREVKREPPPLVVPSGTTVTISTASALGSKISQAGQSFTGTLANSITVGGVTAIPAGANVTGTVVDAKPLGRFAGGASLQLKLTSININGVDTAVQPSNVTDVQAGKGKRTAVLAGGGAALGALIGGLAGGGKGAAIGALAGGGAGTGGAALTGTKDIVLPAESNLSFTLQQSLTIKR